jgi:uncharacterized membrane protein
MDSYTLLLFLHVAMAVIWVGGGAMIQVFALRVLASGESKRLADLGADIEWISTRVFVPASLLAALSGVALVVDSSFIEFGDRWILFGIALYAITFTAGAGFFGPEAGRIGKLTAEHGAESPEVQARLERLIRLSRFDLVLLFLIIYTMAVKPYDAGDFALGIAGALVAAGLVYWRAQAAGARTQTAPS